MLKEWLGRLRGTNVEERQSYTDALVEAYLARAASQDVQDDNLLTVYAQAAIETAVGFWARGFMSLHLQPAVELISTEMMGLIGRGLCRQGESVWYFDGREYHQVSNYEVRQQGGIKYYQVTYSDPDRLVTKDFVSPGQVLHVRYSVDPVQPWRGIGPLMRCSETVSLLARTEHHFRQEMSSTIGNILPQPSPPGSEDATRFAASLKGLSGRTAIVQSQRTSWGQPGGRTDSDWRVTRLGADPKQAAVILRQQVETSVLEACGIPPGLLATGSESSVRDSWRLFVTGTIFPYALMLAEEVSHVTGMMVKATAEELRATDVATMARAFQSLVASGVKPMKALELVGFDGADISEADIQEMAPPPSSAGDILLEKTTG